MSWWQSREICSLLRCPICGVDVQVEVNDAGNGLAICLSSSCGEAFPIIAGIPRFLIGKAREEFLRTSVLPHNVREYFAAKIEKSQESTRIQYSRTWERIYRQSYSGQPFNSGKPLSLGTFHKFLRGIRVNDKELILDAGCGLGRFVACACHLAPKAIVVGIDLSRGVDLVPRVVRHADERYLERCLVVQGSIFSMPLKPAFDLVFSFGVLHHTPNPKKAFGECLKMTTHGGIVLAWLYGDDFKQRHPWLWRLIHLARQFHSQLHPELLWALCHLYALSAPLLRWRYNFSVSRARYFWLDNLSNPFNFVFNREELLNWLAEVKDLLEYYAVDALFRGWRIEAQRRRK